MNPSPLRTALVLGGNSDIALATVRRLADRRTSGAALEQVVLAVRDPDGLRARLAADPIAGPDPASGMRVDVAILPWDALDLDAHGPLLDAAITQVGQIDLVLCAVGSLGHGAGISGSARDASDLIAANFGAPAAALTAAAGHLVRQGHGVVVVLSSVAGLRARKSNYLYGSAKAGLDAFTQGLADAVAADGVQVHLIRPGFVTSKMTTGLRPAPFATTTDAVAKAIADVVTRSSSRIVHVPKLLGPMFGVLRLTPRPIWRRIAGDR